MEDGMTPKWNLDEDTGNRDGKGYLFCMRTMWRRRMQSLQGSWVWAIIW